MWRYVACRASCHSVPQRTGCSRPWHARIKRYDSRDSRESQTKSYCKASIGNRKRHNRMIVIPYHRNLTTEHLKIGDIKTHKGHRHSSKDKQCPIVPLCAALCVNFAFCGNAWNILEPSPRPEPTAAHPCDSVGSARHQSQSLDLRLRFSTDLYGMYTRRH